MTRPGSIIELDNVCYRWKQGDPDLLSIDRLAVRPAERLFIQGPSGCGKTTLLNLIAGVVRPVSGSVRVLGRAISTLKAGQRDAFRADHVGFVFQQFNLLPYLSMVDNVILPCRFSKLKKIRALEAAASVDAAAVGLLNRLGFGGGERRKTGAGQLSVGQQQRVAVARALIGSPEIVIADEPTSALDEAAQEAFLALLFEACSERGSTLVFVSHNRRLESMFDRVVALPEINRAGTAGAAED